LFVNSENGDYHLFSNSPAIDSGNSSLVPGTDIDGNPRTITVDIGAYEWQDKK